MARLRSAAGASLPVALLLLAATQAAALHVPRDEGALVAPAEGNTTGCAQGEGGCGETRPDKAAAATKRSPKSIIEKAGKIKSKSKSKSKSKHRAGEHEQAFSEEAKRARSCFGLSELTCRELEIGQGPPNPNAHLGWTVYEARNANFIKVPCRWITTTEKCITAPVALEIIEHHKEEQGATPESARLKDFNKIKATKQLRKKGDDKNRKAFASTPHPICVIPQRPDQGKKKKGGEDTMAPASLACNQHIYCVGENCERWASCHQCSRSSQVSREFCAQRNTFSDEELQTFASSLKSKNNGLYRGPMLNFMNHHVESQLGAMWARNLLPCNDDQQQPIVSRETVQKMLLMRKELGIIHSARSQLEPGGGASTYYVKEFKDKRNEYKQKAPEKKQKGGFANVGDTMTAEQARR